MEPTETVSSAKPAVANVRRNYHSAKYKKVLDGRKQPIRGLYIRNGRYIARITIEDDDGMKRKQWVALEDAETVPQAQEALKALHVDRTRSELPVLKRTPKFSDYCVKEYYVWLDTVKDAKRPATVEKEKSALKLWMAHMGGIRLDKIRRVHINKFIEKRQKDGISGRTVNLDVIALRNVLKRAIDDGWIKVLPTQNMRPLKWTAPKRGLVTKAEIEKLAKKGLKVSKNGRQFADYVLLMAYSGARRNEALRLRWPDVDWDKRQLTIGADGLNKGGEIRVVDFNDDLEKHLKAMRKRKAPDIKWMFPSPQRGEKDIHAETFKQSLDLARGKAKLPNFTFHDCRHFFISFCVMSGIDYMTIAKWVDHKDGGVLIGKVYGHLSNEHAQAQAARLQFVPVVLKSPNKKAA